MTTVEEFDEFPAPFDARISVVPDAIDTRCSDYSFRQILSDIQNGRWRPQVEKVRTAFFSGGKKAAAPFKKSLPAALFSGTFSVREDSHLTHHSGLICVDLDDLGDKLEATRDLIVADSHTVAAFRSPSGNGLKVIFRCSSNPEDHHDSFRRAEQFVLQNFGLEIDPACKNVGRMCFVSHDPELFQAADATPLPPCAEVTEFKAPVESKPGAVLLSGLTPGDDYDQKINLPSLLQEHGWTKVGRHGWMRPGGSQISATWDKVPGRFFVFSSSTNLPENHYLRPWHVYAFLKHNGNFKAAAQALYQEGYGERVKPPLQSKNGTHPESTPSSLKPERIEELRLLLKSRAFDISKPLPKPREIYAIAGTRICTPGNLTTIYSQAKTGKSSLVGAMIAATFTTPTSNHDTLQVTGPNYDNRAVLHFDTEQSPYDWQQLILTSLRRVGLSQPPPFLLSHSLTGLSAQDARQSIEQQIKDAHAQFGGIHSVIIDGIADLVIDPNDPAECFPLVTRLHAMAIEFDTAIISILHMNPGSEVKGRGHLGSQLERKSESNLTLTKDGDTSMVSSTKQRGKSIPADKAPSFRWSDDSQMHVSTKTPESAQKKKPGRPEMYPFSDFSMVLPAKDEMPLPLNQITSRCNVNKPIKSNQMFNVLKRWEEEGYVAVTDSPKGKLYRKRL